MTSLYERLSQEVEQLANGNYVDESILEFFEPKDLQDITIDEWVHKQLKDLPEAAIHAAGYNPTKGTLFGEEFKHKIWTADLELKLDEKNWLFAQKHGLADMGVAELGKKVAKMASKFMTVGQDAAGNAVEGNTNFLFDEGTGNGTLIRPISVTQATAGAWSTWANQNTDVTALLALHEAKNYNIYNSVVFYPKSAAYAMRRGGANVREASAIEYLLGQGVLAVIGIPDIYFYTVANAAPAIGAFDLGIVDLSQFQVGYTRKQRTLMIGPHDEERGTTIQCEVWFGLYCKPQVLVESGTAKVYKGLTTITAINGA
jgi:hypothetical protein